MPSQREYAMKYPRPYDLVIYFTARTCKFCEYFLFYLVNFSLNTNILLTFMKIWEPLIKTITLLSLFRWPIAVKLCIFMQSLVSKELQIWSCQNPIWLWSVKFRRKLIFNSLNGASVRQMDTWQPTKCLNLSTKGQEKTSFTNLQFWPCSKCSLGSSQSQAQEFIFTLEWNSSGTIGSFGLLDPS